MCYEVAALCHSTQEFRVQNLRSGSLIVTSLGYLRCSGWRLT